MTKIENDCCDCSAPGFPCVGTLCKLYRVPHTYCDVCGNEADEMYEVDGDDICADCLTDYLIDKGIIGRKN